MKTISVTKPGEISILDTPLPIPKSYQALVKTEVACICNNTDSELVNGHFPGMENSFPFALGHESIGKVVEVGDKAKNFKTFHVDISSKKLFHIPLIYFIQVKCLLFLLLSDVSI